jgi:hypothetical protein
MLSAKNRLFKFLPWTFQIERNDQRQFGTTETSWTSRQLAGVDRRISLLSVLPGGFDGKDRRDIEIHCSGPNT